MLAQFFQSHGDFQQVILPTRMDRDDFLHHRSACGEGAGLVCDEVGDFFRTL